MFNVSFCLLITSVYILSSGSYVYFPANIESSKQYRRAKLSPSLSIMEGNPIKMGVIIVDHGSKRESANEHLDRVRAQDTLLNVNNN